jgi:hypothetical protein
MSASDITIQQSATFSQDWELTDRDGNLIDTSQYTGRSQMRKIWTSNTAWNFGVTLDTGKLTLDMSAANTAGIAPGNYVFDVVMQTGNTVYRVIEGSVTVTPEISR